MSHTKIPDEFIDEAWDLSDAAVRLHVAGLVYSMRLLTDGRVPSSRLPGLVPRYRPAVVTELTRAGWWRADGDSFVIVKTMDRQDTSEQIRARRAKSAARVAAWRAAHG